MFAHREGITHNGIDTGVNVAVTDRFGGVSSGPYAELNLGGGVEDDRSDVEANRALLAAAIGVRREQLMFMRQVHGCDVAVADGPWSADPPEADGLVTTQRGIALAVLVADCTPVMLVAPAEGVVGVAHAGRSGLAAGIVTAVVDAMRDLGARTLIGRVGPSICGRCYEVPLAMREEVSAVAPEARSRTWWGTPSLDVAAGVMGQLAPYCADLMWLPGCSRERADLYSYRRDRIAGRFAGLAWMAP